MPSYSRGAVVLVRYSFSDLSGAKIRPAVVVNDMHESNDLIIVPLTSRTTGLKSGEFVLADLRTAGLNVATAAKRGVYTVEERLVIKHVGHLSQSDFVELERALGYWLGLRLAP
jgi:mRNA interferase MazF